MIHVGVSEQKMLNLTNINPVSQALHICVRTEVELEDTVDESSRSRSYILTAELASVSTKFAIAEDTGPAFRRGRTENVYLHRILPFGTRVARFWECP